MTKWFARPSSLGEQLQAVITCKTVAIDMYVYKAYDRVYTDNCSQNVILSYAMEVQAALAKTKCGNGHQVKNRREGEQANNSDLVLRVETVCVSEATEGSSP